MTEPFQIQPNADLAFFGRINASISHELKNILAIISETSGLIGDLVDMAEKGKNTDMGLFKSCSRDIEEEIQRGFTTIRAMNVFSHSVDETVECVSPSELVRLMVDISSYLSYARKVEINPSDQADVKVTTCPFRLQRLVYNALVFSYRITGPEGVVRVSLNGEPDGGVRISFSCLGRKEPFEFPFEEMKAFAGTFHAGIRSADNFQSFEIIVPQAIT